MFELKRSRRESRTAAIVAGRKIRRLDTGRREGMIKELLRRVLSDALITARSIYRAVTINQGPSATCPFLKKSPQGHLIRPLYKHSGL
jgi:hypothetical protein